MTVDVDHHLTFGRLELIHDLTTGAARRRSRCSRRTDRDGDNRPVSLGGGRQDGDTFATDGEPKTGIFDIHANNNIPGIGKSSGADGKVGVWNIGILCRNPRRVDETLWRLGPDQVIHRCPVLAHALALPRMPASYPGAHLVTSSGDAGILPKALYTTTPPNAGASSLSVWARDTLSLLEGRT